MTVSSPAIMPQQRGLAAARRADEDDELAVARSSRSTPLMTSTAPKDLRMPSSVKSAMFPAQPFTAPMVMPLMK